MSEHSDDDASLGDDGHQAPSGAKYAEDAAKDKLYEPKKARKIIRVLTVVAYVFSVSLAAIMLSLYYVFLWDPKMPTTGRQVAGQDPEPQPCSQHALLDTQPVNPAMAQMQPSFSPLQKTDEITLSTLMSSTESPLYKYITQGRTVVTTLQTQQPSAKVPTLMDT